jgi:hypothetical protein
MVPKEIYRKNNKFISFPAVAHAAVEIVFLLIFLIPYLQRMFISLCPNEVDKRFIVDLCSDLQGSVLVVL